MASQKFSTKQLWLLSIPSIAATTVEFSAEFIDTAFAGRMSVASLSALASCNTIFASSIWIFNFLLHVGNAQLAGEVESQAGTTTRQANSIKLGLLTGTAIGMLVSLMLYFSMGFLLSDILKLSDIILSLSETYFVYRLPGIAFSFLGLSCLGMIRGMQKLVLSFYIVLIQVGLNVAITFLCIEHLDMGLKGAAIGTSIAQIALTAFMLAWFCKKLGLIHIRSSWLAIPYEQVFDFGKNSIHQFMRAVYLNSTFLVAILILSRTSALDMATHQIAMQFWLLSAYLLDGIAVTATSIGGRLIATQAFDQWRLVSKRLHWMSFWVGCLFCGSYVFFPNLIKILTDKEVVFSHIQLIWPIVALLQIPNAIAFAQDGLAFGLKAFKHVRHALGVGVFTLFMPFAAIGVLSQNELLGVWLGNAALNLFRLWKARKYLPEVVNKLEASATQ